MHSKRNLSSDAKSALYIFSSFLEDASSSQIVVENLQIRSCMNWLRNMLFLKLAANFWAIWNTHAWRILDATKLWKLWFRFFKVDDLDPKTATSDHERAVQFLIMLLYQSTREIMFYGTNCTFWVIAEHFVLNEAIARVALSERVCSNQISFWCKKKSNLN